MEHDLRVEYRFKNAILYRELARSFEPWMQERRKKITRRGTLGFVKFASQTIGISYGALNELLCLRNDPYSTNPNKQGQLRGAARKIADFLGMSAEELFPEPLYALKLPRVAVREFSSPQILSLQEAQAQHLLPLVAPEGEELIVREEKQEELRKALDETMSMLTPRERLITYARFGEPPKSYDEIGEELGLSRERVRQIEAKVLRNLREPSHNYALRKCLDRQVPARLTSDSDTKEEEPQCASKP